jgi:hypothetical protein
LLPFVRPFLNPHSKQLLLASTSVLEAFLPSLGEEKNNLVTTTDRVALSYYYWKVKWQGGGESVIPTVERDIRASIVKGCKPAVSDVEVREMKRENVAGAPPLARSTPAQTRKGGSYSLNEAATQ